MRTCKYTELAIESMISDLKAVRKQDQRLMTQESDYILECLECGIILEAEGGKKKESVWARIHNAIKSLLDKVVNLFKDKSEELDRQHREWLKLNKDIVIKIASRSNVEVVPFWNSDLGSASKDLINAVKQAVASARDGSFNDTFCQKIVSPQYLDDDSLVEYVKNYLRVNKKDAIKLEQVSLSKGEFASKLEGMIEYMINYTGKTVPLSATLKKEIDNELTRLVGARADKGASDVYVGTAESYIMVEQRMVCESDLRDCVNYTAVYEAGNKPKPKASNAGQAKKGSGGEKEQTEITNSDGEEVSAKAATVTTEEPKDGESTENEKEKEYGAKVEKFIKLAVTCFTSVAEEKYVAYANIIKGLKAAATEEERKQFKEPDLSKDDKTETNTKVSAPTVSTKSTPEKKSILNKLGKKKKKLN